MLKPRPKPRDRLLCRFGYALVNGTIGVYERLDRVWRVKSKHSVCALASYDLDGDGYPELISGWSNGRVGAGGCRAAALDKGGCRADALDKGRLVAAGWVSAGCRAGDHCRLQATGM